MTTPAAGNYDEAPDWSPDGTSLVFSERTFAGTASVLEAVAADGSEVRQLTNGSADYDPSWSPDGANVVFRRRAVASGSFQLYTVGAGGGTGAQLLGSVLQLHGTELGKLDGEPRGLAAAAGTADSDLQPRDQGLYFPGSTDQVFYACSSDVSDQRSASRVPACSRSAQPSTRRLQACITSP